MFMAIVFSLIGVTAAVLTALGIVEWAGNDATSWAVGASAGILVLLPFIKAVTKTLEEGESWLFGPYRFAKASIRYLHDCPWDAMCLFGTLFWLTVFAATITDIALTVSSANYVKAGLDGFWHDDWAVCAPINIIVLVLTPLVLVTDLASWIDPGSPSYPYPLFTEAALKAVKATSRFTARHFLSAVVGLMTIFGPAVISGILVYTYIESRVAIEAGYEAGAAGEARTTNPYSESAEKGHFGRKLHRDYWDKGYSKGQLEAAR